MKQKKEIVVVYLASVITVVFCLSCTGMSRLFDKGGNEFVVEVVGNESNDSDILERAILIMKSKINAIGLRGEVTTNPSERGQMIVKIFGNNDWKVVKRFLFTSNQLEFRKAVSPPNPSPLQTFPTKGLAEKELADNQEILPYLGRDAENSAFVIVESQPILNGEGVSDAKAVSSTGNENNYQISFSLKMDAAIKFGSWTEKNIGNYLAIVLDRKVQSVAFIKSQILDQGQIDGRFTKQAAEEIALSLKSGYLPATMKVIEEKPFEK